MDFLSSMTYYDYIVIAILLVSIMFAIYKGFISSAGSCAVVVCALLLALCLTDNLAYTIQQKTNMLEEVIYYVQADEKITDLSTRKLNVYNLTDEEVETIVNEANLPEVFADRIISNVENKVFKEVETIGDYFDYTVCSTILNIMCFGGIFIFSAIVLSILKASLESLVKIPALKFVDGAVGAAFGALRGVLFVYIFLMIVPVILVVLPESVVSLIVGDIAETPIASAFYNSNFLMSFIGSFIKVI